MFERNSSIAVVMILRLLSIGLLPFTISTYLATPLSASEGGRIFYSHDGIAFATPDEALRRLAVGASVAIRTAGGDWVGRGEIFRTRPEHVTVKILEGRGQVGDLARPNGEAPGATLSRGGAAPLARPIVSAARDAASPANASVEAHPAATLPVAGVILVYRLGNAPRILADRFDSDFARSLLKEAGADSDLTIRLKDRPRNLRLSATRIRREAKRVGAAFVLVPDYRASAAGDSLAVHLHDAATGQRLGTAATPIRLFENLVFLPDGRRIGRLHLLGRYEGFEPAPDDLRLDETGDPIVRIDREWFAIHDGAARFLRDYRPRRGAGATTTFIGGTPHRISAEPTPGGFERIVIQAGGRTIYATSPIGPDIPIAARGDRFAFVDGSVLKLLRIDANVDTAAESNGG